VVVDALPAPDATAIVRRRLSRPWPRLGGCGPEIAAHLAAAGVGTACLTWVGDDAIGRALLGQLEASGADTSGVVVDGGRSPESFIVYDAQGRTACFFDPGDATADTLSRDQRELVGAAELVCLTVAPAAATEAALDDTAPDARLVWSVKADRDAYPRPLVERLLARADVVALSAGERAFLDGRTPRHDAIVIETHGAGGVRWEHRGRVGHHEVSRIAVRDTTGAGDALVAGAIAQLRRDADDVAAAVAAGIESSRALLERRGREEEGA
jgi:sugar/nucleoside kinase (ribokinase family)